MADKKLTSVKSENRWPPEQAFLFALAEAFSDPVGIGTGFIVYTGEQTTPNSTEIVVFDVVEETLHSFTVSAEDGGGDDDGGSIGE